MKNLLKLIVRKVREESGQDLVEYALLVALIAFAATTAIKGVSSEINQVFGAVSSDLASSLQPQQTGGGH